MFPNVTATPWFGLMVFDGPFFRFPSKDVGFTNDFCFIGAIIEQDHMVIMDRVNPGLNTRRQVEFPDRDRFQRQSFLGAAGHRCHHADNKKPAAECAAGFSEFDL